jgi:hypothetical protein
MEQVETANGNGQGNGTLAGLPEHISPAKSAVQKRINKITREKHEANQRVRQLQQENQEFRLAIAGYEEVLRRFKLALRAARRQYGR